MVVRTDICSFSGSKIYPGKGSRLIKNDAKIMIFQNQKIKKLYNFKVKAFRLKWTTVYRKLKKKAIN